MPFLKDIEFQALVHWLPE